MMACHHAIIWYNDGLCWIGTLRKMILELEILQFYYQEYISWIVAFNTVTIWYQPQCANSFAISARWKQLLLFVRSPKAHQVGVSLPEIPNPVM